MTLADVQAAEKAGLALIEETGAYYVNQFNNEANALAHYETTGPEIWRQSGGKVDAFVATIGTAGTFVGTSRYLKEKNQDLYAAVVEPAGAEPIKGEPITKPQHLLQGSGYGCVPNLFKRDTLTETIAVTDQEAVEYKHLLGSKEGLYMGYTSGANVAAAIKLLQSGKLDKDAVVVTVLNDSGLKYPYVEDYGF